jgi:lysosomal Pro-X carboxypeptidase
MHFMSYSYYNTLFAAALLSSALCTALKVPQFTHPRLPTASTTSNRPSTANCEVKYFTQQLDHFSSAPGPFGVTTFQQRYFWCDEHYKPGSPLLLYCGNEADVTLYVNATGAMWAAAEQLSAVLVFAEHRFYGESQPFASTITSSNNNELPHREHLSAAQALADLATLVQSVKLQPEQRVVAYGGSYGGMLAAWLRIKYPHIVHGAVAASAPVCTVCCACYTPFHVGCCLYSAHIAFDKGFVR